MAKFCTNCGSPVEDGQNNCMNCGAPIKKGKATSKKSETVETNYEQTTNSNYTSNQGSSNKSKVVAGVLGIFFGAFGVHNFYLGYTGKAVAQLLISVLSCCVLSGVSAIWGLIEGILILCGSINTDANGNELVD